MAAFRIARSKSFDARSLRAALTLASVLTTVAGQAPSAAPQQRDPLTGAFIHAIERKIPGLSSARRSAREFAETAHPDCVKAARAARAWLVTHQRPDGTWPAEPGYRIGTMALAMLALMADGVTLRTGPKTSRRTLKRSVVWLRDHLDRNTGRICVTALPSGSETDQRILPEDARQQTLAALALAEAYATADYMLIKRPAAAATKRIGATKLRWPSRAGEEQPMDSWQVLVAAVSRAAELPFDDESKAPEQFEFTLDAQELASPAPTASAFALSRLLLEQTSTRQWFEEPDPTERPPGASQTENTIHALPIGERTRLADLISAWRPRYEPDDTTSRLSDWPNHALALHCLSPAHSQLLTATIHSSLLPAQRTDPIEHGSWDPIGADGRAAGRAYTTATILLTLQAAHRYPN